MARRTTARFARLACLSAALVSATGCQTLAGRKLPSIEPPAPSFQPSVEHSVGAFTYVMNSADPKPSTLDGKLLGNEVMRAWKERGYVRDERLVKKGEFSGTADYHLTLSGSQHNEVSFFAEVLSALTLMFAPYTVTQNYDLHYVLEDVHSGAKYTASVQETDQTQVQLFLLFTFPLAKRGHRDTMQRVGDHLYDQFYRQGAFQKGSPARPVIGRGPSQEGSPGGEDETAGP
jgi:hypothetical protein